MSDHLDGLALLHAIRGGDRSPETVLAYADWLAEKVEPTVYVWDNGESYSDHDIEFVTAEGLEPADVIAAYRAREAASRWKSGAEVVAVAGHWSGGSVPMHQHIRVREFIDSRYDFYTRTHSDPTPTPLWDAFPANVARWLYTHWKNDADPPDPVLLRAFEAEAARRGILGAGAVIPSARTAAPPPR